MFNDQAEHAVAIASFPSAVFTPSVIFIGTAGNLTVVTKGNETVAFNNLGNGSFLPVLCVQIVSGTASNVVMLN